MSPRCVEPVSWIFILIGLSANWYVVLTLSIVCAPAFSHLIGASGPNSALKVGHIVMHLRY